MQLSALDFVLWALGLVGHLALFVVLISRHRAAEFPYFTGLIAANICRTVVLYVVLHYRSAEAYSLCYWSLAIVDLGLQLAVVYEISAHIFRPLGHWAPDARRAYLTLISCSLFVAFGLAWLAPPSAQTWQQNVVVRGSLFSTALMSEIFIVVVAISTIVRLPWKTHVARLAQGLGVYSIVDMLIEAAHNLLGLAYILRIDTVLTHLRIVLYLACLVYWIITLYRNAPKAKPLGDEQRMFLVALQERVAAQLALLRHGRQ